MSPINVPALNVRRFDRPDLAGVQVISPRLQLRVDSYSWSVIGGPETATIAVLGDQESLGEVIDWLRCGIEIVDEQGTPVWWGYVNAVRLHLGAVEIGVTLENMANTVQVAYTNRIVGEQTGGSAETAWLDDDASVSTYGIKELRITSDISDLASAEALRNATLANLLYPVPTVRIGDTDDISGTLECVGWWATGDWRYYEEDAVTVSFTDEGDHVLYSAYTISFDQDQDQVNDAANGGTGALPVYSNGERVMVTGVNTRGIYTVDTTTVTPTTHTFQTAEDLGGYGAGAFVQLENAMLPVGYSTSERGVAQSFTAPTPTAKLNSITVWVRTFENPTSLRLKMDLFADAGGGAGPTGAVLASGYNSRGELGFSGSQDIPAGAPSDFIPATPPMQPRTFRMLSGGNEITLTAGALYWIVLTSDHASGFNGAEFFTVQINRAGGAPGALKQSNATVWNAATGDMLHIVSLKGQTTTQISDIVTGSLMPFLAGAIIESTSGVYSDVFRDGSATVRTEIEDLLAMGTSNGKRLLATVTRERYLRVYEEPAIGADVYRLRSDGQLRDKLDQIVPAHTCPVGVWVKLIDVIPMTADLSRIGSPSPFFVDWAEYNVQTGRLRIEPKAAPSPRDGDRIMPG